MEGIRGRWCGDTRVEHCVLHVFSLVPLLILLLFWLYLLSYIIVASGSLNRHLLESRGAAEPTKYLKIV
jgi:hypothetical protein